MANVAETTYRRALFSQPIDFLSRFQHGTSNNPSTSLPDTMLSIPVLRRPLLIGATFVGGEIILTGCNPFSRPETPPVPPQQVTIPDLAPTTPPLSDQEGQLSGANLIMANPLYMEWRNERVSKEVFVTITDYGESHQKGKVLSKDGLFVRTTPFVTEPPFINVSHAYHWGSPVDWRFEITIEKPDQASEQWVSIEERKVAVMRNEFEGGRRIIRELTSQGLQLNPYYDLAYAVKGFAALEKDGEKLIQAEFQKPLYIVDWPRPK